MTWSLFFVKLQFLITHFMPLISFYTSWKYQETKWPLLVRFMSFIILLEKGLDVGFKLWIQIYQVDLAD